MVVQKPAQPSMIFPLAGSSPSASSSASSDADSSEITAREDAARLVPVHDTKVAAATASTRGSTFWRDWMLKYGSFIILVANHTAFTMLLRASKTTSGPRYLSTAAVAMMETAKLFCSVLMLVITNGPVNACRVLYEGVMLRPKYLVILSLPSLLYVVQNNLQHIALEHLDAVVYLLCKQLKLLATAVLSVMMLKKHLQWQQWLALVMLTCGVAVVQLSKMLSKNNAAEHHDNPLIGLLAVLACVVLSGYAGVYFEKVLKKGKAGKAPDSRGADGLWVRNIQMSASSVPVAFAMTFSRDHSKIATDGFFYGWTDLVIAVVFMQAVGGLLNSVVVNYMDNIIKGFASSYCILATLVMEMIMFNFKPGVMFLVGAATVVLASLIYGKYSRKSKAKPSQVVRAIPVADDQEDVEAPSTNKNTIRERLL